MKLNKKFKEVGYIFFISCLILGLGYRQTSRETVEDYFKTQFHLSLENIFFGEFHSHTSYSADATAFGTWWHKNVFSAEGAYVYARDVQKFDFIGLSDHPEWPNPLARPEEDKKIGLSIWQSLHRLNMRFNNEDAENGKVFIVFPGYEYTNTFGMQKTMGSSRGYGHKNVIFKKIDPDSLPKIRYGAGYASVWEGLANTAFDLWKNLSPFGPANFADEGRVLTIVHTPAAIGKAKNLNETGGSEDHRTDWEAMDSNFVRNLEISSKWGNSEGPPPPNAHCPAEDPFDYSVGINLPLTVRSILYEKWILNGDERYVLSFLGGTDNHRGLPGSFEHPMFMMKYPGAITGIISKNLTRDSLWSNLWQRHTIAVTTSENNKRIPLLFAIETKGQHLLMGDLGEHDGLLHVRAFSVPEVQEIEIIMDGCLNKKIEGNEIDFTLKVDPGRHYIYLRANYFEDNNKLVTWTSPIYLKSEI